MKIVVNRRYGGYGLSEEAYEYLGLEWDGFGFAYEYDLKTDSGNIHHTRADPKLVECVECLGRKADGEFAALEIVEIPDDVDWEIQEYDGIEWIAEKHRTW